MKQTFAAFSSQCAETGRYIRKGEPIVYDKNRKLCYCMESKKAKEFLKTQNTKL